MREASVKGRILRRMLIGAIAVLWLRNQLIWGRRRKKRRRRRKITALAREIMGYLFEY